MRTKWAYEMKIGDIGSIASILGVVLAVVFWLIGPAKAVKFIKRLLHWRLDIEAMIALEAKGLIIENKELLLDKYMLRKRKYIFWPVVPTDAPNLIHAVFLRYLKELSSSGLVTIVFIFDYYYEIITKSSPSLRKDVIHQFINGLKELGLSDCSHKIILESEFLRRHEIANDVLSKLFFYLGDMTVGNLTQISRRKSYITDTTVAIRYFKPVLNMLYLKSVDIPIGMTLSGYDEREIWDTFRLSLRDGRTIRLTNLYIPILPKLTGDKTHVLDKVENITINDSIIDIRNKLVSSNLDLDPGGLIGIALEFLVFSKSNKVKIRTGEDSWCECDSLADLSRNLKERTIQRDYILDALATSLYSALHKKGKVL